MFRLLPPVHGKAFRTWIQVAASLAALAGTLYFVDRAEILRHLRHMQVGWLALTLAILLAQFVVAAARWWFFARKLAAPIGFSYAVAEYFLTGFLNQVLPFGILGDVARGIRHARAARVEGGPGNARVVLAIVLERAAGQFALWLVVAAILPGWWQATTALPRHALALGIFAGLLLVASATLAVLAWQRWRVSPGLKQLLSESWRTMFAPRHLVVHLPLSMLLVAAHTLAFVTIAHGLGLHLPFALAIRVVPLVLVTTSLPAFIAGWGVREATLAALFHLAGLRGAEGVTIALVFGCLSLVATVPGILALRRKADSLESPIPASG
jgi:glycosyltransferase 2 family protein